MKICGVTRLDDAQLAVELGAWAVGMVFYSASQRLDEIADVSERVGLTLVQLHGDEGPAFCAEVARRTGARTIKAASVRGLFTVRSLERFHTDFHLVDGYAPGLRGGTGERFDYSLLSKRRSKLPLIVGGGLDADRVGAAIATTHPFAVDVASGVEASPGIKDPQRMRAFFDAAAKVAA